MDREEKQRLIRRLTQAFNRIDGAYYYCARRLGVEENTLALLYALDDGRPHSQKQVCEEWLIPKTTINTIVRELVGQGYLLLETEPQSREKALRLTPAGRAWASRNLEKLYRMEEDAMRQMLSSHSGDFVQSFSDFADCLKHSFDQTFSFAEETSTEESG